MTALGTWAIQLHVAAGVLAVLAGLSALVTAKGGRRHRLAGRTFVASMGLVVATTFLILALGPTSFRVFLALVAVFSGYLAFSGYRVLSRGPAGDDPGAVDWAAAVGVAVACLGLGGWGVVRLAGGSSFGVVLVAFGAIGLAFGVNDLRRFRASERPESRVALHLTRMLGAFVATVSAVSAVNLTGALGVVAWLWPTAVGVPLIAYWAQKYGG
ncbi:DUF2306 domain-containing protein [Halorussus halobius]|uniref:hypothetical protein n=1 Tax=Halorussus halobius TaxID=1710537 RepID=UPI0010933024|nr:hypothetical protein [Halorussus halobius]